MVYERADRRAAMRAPCRTRQGSDAAYKYRVRSNTRALTITRPAICKVRVSKTAAEQRNENRVVGSGSWTEAETVRKPRKMMNASLSCRGVAAHEG